MLILNADTGTAEHLHREMAIYTYLCNKCNRRFDIFQGKEPAICDICQGKDVKRVFTAPMVRTSRQENSSSSCSSCTKTTCASCK